MADLRQENHQRVQGASENLAAGQSSAHPSRLHEVAMVMMTHWKAGAITAWDSQGPLWTPHSPVGSTSQFQSASFLSCLTAYKFG